MSEQDNIKTKINFRSETFKKYLENTSWLFAEKIIRLLITFFVGIYIIRYLGPDDFGLLSYALSFAGLFFAISTLGLDSIVVRELVKEPQKREALLGSVFTLRIAGAVMAITLTAIAAMFSGEDTFTLILILIIAASTIFQSLGVVEQYFQSIVKAKYNVYAQSGSVFIAAILKVLLIIFEYPLIYFAIVQTTESLLLGLGYFIVYRYNKLNIFKWKFNFSLARSLLRDSWPLILSGLVVMIYMKIDQVMIKNMLDSKQVGFYAAAVKLCEAWYFIPLAVTTSLFPAIVSAKQTSEQLYLSRLQKLYDILAWTAIAIAVPVTIFSREIITLLFGTGYLPSSPVLTIYIWAGVATFLGVASSQYLISENLTKLSFYRTLIGMVLNVILNLILIPKYGIIGSAYATLISYGVATILTGLTRRTSYQLKMMGKSILLINLFNLLSLIWQYRSKRK